MASKMASMMMAKRSLSSAASSGSKKFLITGGNGCIGAWVVKRLLERGHEPVIFDLGGDLRRIRELTPIYPHPLKLIDTNSTLASLYRPTGDVLPDPQDADHIGLIRGDIGSRDDVLAAVKSSGAEAIIHLAGHQIPLCRAVRLGPRPSPD
jgi:nucleoside-diphosphate-sugar epimerase